MVGRRQGVAVQEPDGTVTRYVMNVNKLIGPALRRTLRVAPYAAPKDKPLKRFALKDVSASGKQVAFAAPDRPLPQALRETSRG